MVIDFETKAYRQGERAQGSGESVDTNPYVVIKTSDEELKLARRRWFDGFYDSRYRKHFETKNRNP